MLMVAGRKSLVKATYKPRPTRLNGRTDDIIPLSDGSSRCFRSRSYKFAITRAFNPHSLDLYLRCYVSLEGRSLAICGEISDGTPSTRPNTVSVYLREALLPTQLLDLAIAVIIYSITSIYHSMSFLARLYAKVGPVETRTKSEGLGIRDW